MFAEMNLHFYGRSREMILHSGRLPPAHGTKLVVPLRGSQRVGPLHADHLYTTKKSRPVASNYRVFRILNAIHYTTCE